MTKVFKALITLDYLEYKYTSEIIELPVEKQTEKTILIKEGYGDKRILTSNLNQITRVSNEPHLMTYKALSLTMAEAEELIEKMKKELLTHLTCNKLIADTMLEIYNNGLS